jgi:hypothetical protein
MTDVEYVNGYRIKKQYLITVMFISLVLAGCSTSSDPSNAETPPSNGLKTVTLLDIPGIPPPAIGAKPVTSIDTEQYKATILWAPTPTNGFEDSLAYVSIIFLSPKVGYTLQGLTENSISVSCPMIPFKLTMITIPAGKYKRDDNAANISSINSFRLSNKEITRAQFEALLGKAPSETAIATGMPRVIGYRRKWKGDGRYQG